MGVRLCEEQVQKSGLGRGIKGRGRFIRNDQRRCADQGARGGHSLLLTDTQSSGSGVHHAVWQAQIFAKSVRFRPWVSDFLPATWSELQRQQDIVLDACIGQQVKLLKYKPDLFRAEPIPFACREICDVGFSDRNGAGLGHDRPANQRQQGRLSRPTFAKQQHRFGPGHGQGRNMQLKRPLAGPLIPDIRQIKDGCVGCQGGQTGLEHSAQIECWRIPFDFEGRGSGR